MAKTPAFQFYPQDFLSDLNVKLMTIEAVGAYVLLLCHEWIEGPLPDDATALASLSGMRERWPEVSEQVLRCFKKRRNRIYNRRLESERKKQREYREKKREAGKESGKARRRKKLQTKNDVNTCSTPVRDVLEQKRTLQSSSSSSSSYPPPGGEESPPPEHGKMKPREKTGAEPRQLSILDLKDRKEALGEVLSGLRVKHNFSYAEERRNHAEAYAEYKSVRAKITEINRQIAGLE